MTTRPILFNGTMVRAILSGQKTQTRRPVTPQPSDTFLPTIGPYQRTLFDKRTGEEYPDPFERFGAFDEVEDFRSPYGAPGDMLWVRETFCNCIDSSGADDFEFTVYQATDKLPHSASKWTPSIHMPRWASRITLEVVSIRVQRVRDISEQDAISEGIKMRGMTRYEGEAKSEFSKLWTACYPRLPWSANPWVWAVEFRRIAP